MSRVGTATGARAARAAPPAAVAQRRLALDLAAAGRRFPTVAAAALVCRGLLGVDAGTLARRLRLPLGHLAAIERGALPGWAVPRRLTALAPALAWSDAGVEASTDADRARRHPAAHRPRAAPRAPEPP